MFDIELIIGIFSLY